MSCISRRALGDHLRFRLTNDKGEDGKWIWVEFRCPNPVPNEGEICKDCSYKLPKFKYQSNQKCNHGIVGGPYPADSKLYGSAYYLAEIKKGWKPLEHDEKRAKEAVNKACMGRKKAVKETVETVKVQEEPVQPVQPVEPEPKKKRAYNRKKPLEQRAKKQTKPEVLLPQIPVVENPLEPKFVEVVAPPMTITDFVVVKVKKLKCQGKDYYYDSASGKIYGISVNGVGAYKGRYKEEDESIDTTFPDSDCE